MRHVGHLPRILSTLGYAIISCNYLVNGTIFGGKHVFDMCSAYFMYNSYNIIRIYHDARSSERQIHVQPFFSEALSTHKEFGEILHIQARIYVKQNDKLFLSELNHNSIRWANFSKNPQLHYPSSSRRVVPCGQHRRYDVSTVRLHFMHIRNSAI